MAWTSASAQVPPQDAAPLKEHIIHNAHNFPLNAIVSEQGMGLRGVSRPSPGATTWGSDQGLSVWRTNEPGIILSVSKATRFREVDAASARRKCVEALVARADNMLFFQSGLARSEEPRADRPMDHAVVLSERMRDPTDRRSILMECIVEPERSEAVFTITHRVSPAERMRAFERQSEHNIAEIIQRTRPVYRLSSGETGRLRVLRLHGCSFIFVVAAPPREAVIREIKFDLAGTGRLGIRLDRDVTLFGGDRAASMTIDMGPLVQSDRTRLAGLLTMIGERCEAVRAGAGPAG
jgi:hypothetical protein